MKRTTTCTFRFNALLIFQFYILVSCLTPTNSSEHKRSPRIVGGEDTGISKFPFMANLVVIEGDHRAFSGGASIISKHWVVTSAPCWILIANHIEAGKAFVHGNSSYWKKGYKEHLIVKGFMHEKYNDSTTDFDIAVVKVKEPFVGRFEKTVPFAGANYKYNVNSTAIVMGWGSTSNEGISVSEVLKYVDVKIVNYKICEENYRRTETSLTPAMFCAVGPGKDACINDSGGPLYQNKTLIGIVSWGGPTCADTHLPGVYTRISLFHDWISNKIKE